MSKEQTNPWDEQTEEVLAGAFIKWDKGEEANCIAIGESIKGILKEVNERENSNKPGEMQKIYTIETQDGTQYRVGSRGQAFDSAMSKIVFGQIVEFKYDSDIPSKKAGNSPFKLVKIYEGQVIGQEKTAKAEEESLSPFES